MPLFTVANEKGQPLNYEVNGKDVAIFYADVEQAKEELKASVEQFPTMGCDLIPVGLGGAREAPPRPRRVEIFPRVGGGAEDPGASEELGEPRDCGG